MDYMALGKPIVAFDLPEHRITADSAALFVPANEVSELARGIAVLMDDPPRRAAMGASGRRRAKVLCWPSSARALLECYAEMLAPVDKSGGRVFAAGTLGWAQPRSPPATRTRIRLIRRRDRLQSIPGETR